MKNLKFTWKNYGMMIFGRDMSWLSIEVASDNRNPIITFSTGQNGITVVDKTYHLNNKILLEQLSTINIPNTNKPKDGCDGDAWEIEIDGEILTGYLDRPKWLEQIKKIIRFDEIFDYADTKIKHY